MVAHCEELQHAASGEQVTLTDADRAALARLVDEHQAATVKRALSGYFASQDKFIVDAGYPIALFEKQFTAFLSRAARKSGAGGAPEWRTDCEARHIPPCRHPAHHALREKVEASGCRHPGVCESIDTHKAMLRDEAPDGATSMNEPYGGPTSADGDAGRL
jgi:hypothetical protein